VYCSLVLASCLGGTQLKCAGAQMEEVDIIPINFEAASVDPSNDESRALEMYCDEGESG
jgi:hypothetical protein